MSRIKIDVRHLVKDEPALYAELARVIREAVDKRIPLIEISPGNVNDIMKKRVLRFLERPEIKTQYHKIVKESYCRVFVHFRFRNDRAFH